MLRVDGRLALSVWMSGDYDQTLVKLLSQYVEAEKNSIIVWDYGDADWLGGQLREAGFEIQSLEQSSKISQHRSLRQSLEMIADWRPVMADLAEADIDALVADIETEFGAYLDEEGFHLPGEA